MPHERRPPASFAVNMPVWKIRLRLVALTLLVWFGPSILVLQRVSWWSDLAALRWILPVFPGVVACNLAGALFGRLPDAASIISGALATSALVGGTLALAHRCQSRSSEWPPLLGAFIVSCLLWWTVSAMLAR